MMYADPQIEPFVGADLVADELRADEDWIAKIAKELTYEVLLDGDARIEAYLSDAGISTHGTPNLRTFRLYRAFRQALKVAGTERATTRIKVDAVDALDYAVQEVIEARQAEAEYERNGGAMEELSHVPF